MDVTDGVLPMLGVKPALGRLFTQADDSPGSPETVMLTDRLLAVPGLAAIRRSSAAGSSSTAGRGKSSACCPELPLSRSRALGVRAAPARSQQDTHPRPIQLRGLARLKPGVTLEQANRRSLPPDPLRLSRGSRRSPGFNAKMFEEAAARSRTCSRCKDRVPATSAPCSGC